MITTSIQNESKWHPHGPPVGSRWPKRPHDGNKRFQYGHKEAPRGPKMAPKGSKMALGDTRMVPRGPHKTPTCPKDGHKSPHEVQMNAKMTTYGKIVKSKKTLFFLSIFNENDLGGAQGGTNFDPFWPI